MKNKLLVGEKIWLKPTSSRNSQQIIECTISNVAKKYFYIDYCKLRFFIEGLKHDAGKYSSAYIVYLSKQELEDEIEIKTLNSKLSPYFPLYGKSILTLETLRKIDAIINL